MDKPIKSFQGHTVSLLSALKNVLISCSFYLLKQGNNTISIPPLSSPSSPHPQLYHPWCWRRQGWQIRVPGKFWSDLKILKVFIIGQKVSFLCFWVFNCNPVPLSFYLPNPVGSRGREEGRPMGMCLCASTSLGGVWRFWVFLAQFRSYWFITVRIQQKHWSVADLFWWNVCNDLALFF